MQTNSEITENLTLNYIEDNYVENNKLLTVYLSFSYFGKDGAAYYSISHLEDSSPTYAMVEGAGELHEAFTEQIEDPEIFEEIKPKIEQFIKQWSEDNIDLLECTSCEKEFDIVTMSSDSDSNWFCPECWEKLEPVMKAEHAELLAKGDIEE